MKTTTIGKAFKLKSGAGLSAKNMISGDFPVFGGNGINGYHNEFLFEEQKIVIGRVGAYCGNVHMTLPQSWITDNALYIAESFEQYNPTYLVHLLRSLNLNRLASQSGQPLISAGRLKNVKIPLPPLPQQKKIAAILDAADAYRQKTKMLIEKYDELTQSLFLDMFGDPVVNPMGWEVINFAKVATNKNSLRVPIKQGDRANMQGNYRYYGATGIVDYINDYKFDGEYLLVAEDGKNLINRKKPIAWVVDGQFWVNNHSHVLEYNGITNLIYLSFYLNNSDISKYVTGIDQFKMNKNNLNRIPISIPPLNLQNQFAERVQIIEAQKSQAQASLSKAEDLFNALLQQAFKGELV